jgi:serine/threonine protein kinase
LSAIARGARLRIAVNAVVPQVGDSLAGYRIELLLGRGGMGAVYLAIHTRLNRKVALKVLVPELAEDDLFRERFIRESQLAASLEHPNAIQIYNADEVDGVLFIAMRYIEGSDLRQLLREQGQLSAKRTVEIVQQVAGALDAAHEASLVHRDVKPANILIEQPSGKVFLSDFGVAKRTSSAGMTKTGSFLGSVDYCPPEQIHGQPVDGRTDTYSLGCVAFHCLAGQPPFPKETDIAVIQAHLTEPVPALSTVRPGLPLALDGVLATAMAKYPQVRYASSGAFAAGFRAAIESDTRQATSPTLIPPRSTAPPALPSRPSQPTRVDPPSGAPADTDIQPAARHGFSRRSVVFATVGLLVIAIGAVAFVVLARKPGAATPKAKTAAGTTVPSTSPSPTFMAAIGQRLRNQIVPYQLKLSEETRTAQATPAAFTKMENAASALDQQVLRTEGWVATLNPASATDKVTLQDFNSALRAQATYAASISDLSTNSTYVTPQEAQRVVGNAGNAQDAYARLSGAAPSLPAMPLNQSDVAGLPALVSSRTTRTVPTSTAVTPTADRAAIMEVLNQYQTDFAKHRAAGLAAIFSPNISRYGVVSGGCGTLYGRSAVVADYAAQFPYVDGYNLVGLTPNQIQLSGSTAQVSTVYHITGGSDGTIQFTFMKIETRWTIQSIDAECPT